MTTSSDLFSESQQVIAGGVNSPVRACGSVQETPVFIAQGQGSHVTSSDGTDYIDFVCSWGPLILGHAHPEVLDTIGKTILLGTTFGAPTRIELDFAKAVCDAIPSLEKIRAVSSGTEATMSAIRLARGYTKRDKIIKINGGYHGHADMLLVAPGSGATTLGIPGSAGVPSSVIEQTHLVPFNDVDAVKQLFTQYPNEIAALIIEPIAGNMGVVPPQKDYLKAIRQLTKEHNALLIFDEVITGFRAAYGGAQSLYNVTPDLTCLGKIIGGGLPAACFGGRTEIMDHLAPTGDVYQAGTLSGNPVAMAAGLKTLEILARPDTYKTLEQRGAYLEQGLTDALNATSIPGHINRVGSVLTLFFNNNPVYNLHDAQQSDTKRFAQFFRVMRSQGILLPPSQFEGWFLSLAHTQDDLDQTIKAAQTALISIK